MQVINMHKFHFQEAEKSFRNYSMHHNDRAFIKKEKLENHIYISMQTLYSQYLGEAPLAAIIALSLLGYNVICFSHQLSAISAIFFLQFLSSSISWNKNCRGTVIFRSLQRCLIGFRSWFWLDDSRIFRVAHKPLLH